MVYWQRAGKRASERSAYVEAISHLRKGLAVLQMLPDTPARLQHELELQTTLGPAWIATKGLGLRKWPRPTPGRGAVSADGGDAGRVPGPAGPVGLS